MATVVYDMPANLAAILDFPKILLILPKTAATFPEISRKHEFALSNRNIIM